MFHWKHQLIKMNIYVSVDIQSYAIETRQFFLEAY